MAPMTAPLRIQRRRTKGWRMPAGTTSVTRPGRWGTAWKIGDNMYDEGCAPEAGQPDGWRTVKTSADAVQAYRQFVDWDPGRQRQSAWDLW